MKKNILLFILMCGAFAGSSQTADFPQESARWVYIVYSDIGDVTGLATELLYGDTLIDNQNYQIVSSGINSGFIRTEDKKVYFLPQDSIQPYILYDFNLELGDSFFNKPGVGTSAPDTIYVVQIDSIMTNSGYRKRWHFGPDMGIWIEGIGSTWSLINPMYQFSLSGFRSLMCFENEGEFIIEGETQMWAGDSLGYITLGCNGIIIGTEEQQQLNNAIQIHPNPFTSEFRIESPLISPQTTINIHQFDGRHVMTVEAGAAIEMSNLPAGIYLLSFIWKERHYFAKIVKV